MSSLFEEKWIASEYLDNGRYGVLTSSNVIVIGISVGLSLEQSKAIADYHNRKIEEKP